MPKPVPIYIEAEESAAIAIMRKLNGMPGVVKLSLDLPQPKPNGHKQAQQRPNKSDTVVRQALLSAKRAISHIEICAALEAGGFSRKSAYGLISVMKKDGQLRSPRKGFYDLTVKGKDMAKEEK